MISRLASYLESTFDNIFQDKNVHKFRRFINLLSILGLIFHLGLIFIAKNSNFEWLSGMSLNYLSALYTPFSFILFYEVFLLVISIPKSTSLSIALQFEIVSLVIFRNVFKDIADFGEGPLSFDNIIVQRLVLDMFGGLIMVFLVSVFYYLIKRSKVNTLEEPPGEELQNFLKRKKAIALLLSLLLIIMSITSFFNWATRVFNQINYAPISLGQIFYVDFFNVMIFTDVFILLISMFHQTTYRFVVRNIGFIISTILIRFSLTAPKPYDVEIALFAVIFGIIVMLINLFQLKFLKDD
tara:strand:- start:1152 stop:2042 length:891 start_codon:yes stop_codon:yes gene_type:complete